MPPTLKAALICDDLRQELGNKVSTMGIYSGLIAFPQGDGAFGVPKLAAVFIIAGLAQVDELRFRQLTSVDPPVQVGGFVQPPVLPPLQVIRRPDPNLDEHLFALFISPAVFQGPGRHSIQVVRGAAGGGPLAQPAQFPPN